MSLSSRCTSRGRWPSRVAQHLQHAVEMARGAGAALHRKPHRLVEHQHVVVLVQRDRLEERAGLLRPRWRRARGFGASSCSGGMRTACPASSRSFGCARLPFTRTSPLRMMRWMWLNDRPGKRASKKRSTPHAGFVGRDGDGLHAGGEGVAAAAAGPRLDVMRGRAAGRLGCAGLRPARARLRLPASRAPRRHPSVGPQPRSAWRGRSSLRYAGRPARLGPIRARRPAALISRRATSAQRHCARWRCRSRPRSGRIRGQPSAPAHDCSPALSTVRTDGRRCMEAGKPEPRARHHSARRSASRRRSNARCVDDTLRARIELRISRESVQCRQGEFISLIARATSRTSCVPRRLIVAQRRSISAIARASARRPMRVARENQQRGRRPHAPASTGFRLRVAYRGVIHGFTRSYGLSGIGSARRLAPSAASPSSPAASGSRARSRARADRRMSGGRAPPGK